MDFDDSGWETVRFPTASDGTGAPYYSLWDGTNNSIFIRREFFLSLDPAFGTYKFYVRHDDDYKVYLNGSLLDSQTGWIGDYRNVNIASSRLRVGRNVLAIQVKQFTGGAYFDCGVFSIYDYTGINEMKAFKQNSTIVNLAGQRLNQPQRGINIVNGKKKLY
jgi:hypothetical protein